MPARCVGRRSWPVGGSTSTSSGMVVRTRSSMASKYADGDSGPSGLSAIAGMSESESDLPSSAAAFRARTEAEWRSRSARYTASASSSARRVAMRRVRLLVMRSKAAAAGRVPSWLPRKSSDFSVKQPSMPCITHGVIGDMWQRACWHSVTYSRNTVHETFTHRVVGYVQFNKRPVVLQRFTQGRARRLRNASKLQAQRHQRHAVVEDEAAYIHLAHTQCRERDLRRPTRSHTRRTPAAPRNMFHDRSRWRSRVPVREQNSLVSVPLARVTVFPPRCSDSNDWQASKPYMPMP